MLDRPVDRDGWMDELGLGQDEVPRLLVVEGSGYRQEAQDRRLPGLEDVRPLGMPDLWHGWSGDLPVVWAWIYGATRAVEPVHALGLCGTPVVVHLAPCHALSPSLRVGDIVLPEKATIGEGASQYYGGSGQAPANLGKVARAAALLATRGVHAHRGTTVTASALLSLPDEMVRKWARAGSLAVDLEASAVFTAAQSLGMRAVSLLYVWDSLPRRPWTEPFSPEEEQAQQRAMQEVWEIALQLG